MNRNQTVVLITGASKGIGRIAATSFAEKGYQVIATDVEQPDDQDQRISFYLMDLKNEKEIVAVFSEVKRKWGNIHILINNGAISKFHRSIFEVETSQFDEVMAVNLRGAFICSKEFIKLNQGEGFGRIINIASTRWNQNEEGWEAYGASKGGLISLTQSMAVSLSGTGITVNAISPGWIETGDYSSLSALDHSQHPSGRVGKPSDIIRACLFLAEEENNFINGSNLVIDGGMTKKMIYLEKEF